MPEPTYDEGHARGMREQAERDEHRRLAACFDRDQSHLDTLLRLAATIRRGIGQVAASLDQSDRALTLTNDLHDALDLMQLDAAEQGEYHRRAER